MRIGPAAAIVSVGAVLLGASAACTALLGVVDFTAGDGGTGRDGAPGRDGAVLSGDDGGVVTCADEDGGVGVPGCPCSVASPTGCNGHAQGQRLICSDGTWTAGPVCELGNNCDSRPGNGQGTCAAIDPNCAHASPGQAICVGESVVQCGPDLVSETPVTTCMNQAC